MNAEDDDLEYKVVDGKLVPIEDTEAEFDLDF